MFIMGEIFSMIREFVVQNILMPALLLIGSTVLIILKSYAEKITKSIIARNETACLEMITQVKNNVLTEIEKVSGIAVGANMQLAEKLKESVSTNKLTSEASQMLHQTAENAIYSALPDSLTDPKGVLSQVMGGPKALDTLVSNLIEKQVVDFKKLR